MSVGKGVYRELERVEGAALDMYYCNRYHHKKNIPDQSFRCIIECLKLDVYRLA